MYYTLAFLEITIISELSQYNDSSVYFLCSVLFLFLSYFCAISVTGLFGLPPNSGFVSISTTISYIFYCIFISTTISPRSSVYFILRLYFNNHITPVISIFSIASLFQQPYHPGNEYIFYCIFISTTISLWYFGDQYILFYFTVKEPWKHQPKYQIRPHTS